MSNENELQKRTAAAHKMNIGKAMMHLGKAAECREAGMTSMDKAAGCFTDAKKAGKKEMPMDEAAGHLVKAAGHFNDMEEHQSLAEHHIGKVANAWGMGSGLPTATGGTIDTKTMSEMIEGEVEPQFTGGTPDPKKGAFVTEGEAAAREKAAKLEGELAGSTKLVEALSRMPAGGPRARVFALDKTAFGGEVENGANGGSPMAKLMDGISFDAQDPDSVNKAAAGMIANMIGDTLKGGKTFGRPVISDPNFKGAAASAKR
jgi:hypothetical protein